MALRFPEKILEDILNRVDIVELISGYIPLKKAGRNFRAACPFHHEKTPSFMVSPEKGIYHCFGCNAGGNAFSFLMRYEHLDFREAVETLAKRVGVVIPVLEHDENKVNLNQEIYRINELAAEFYHRNLLNSESAQTARSYLAKRKIKLESAKQFKLGFATDSWDSLLNYLRANKVNLNIIEKSGLVVAKENGGFYDRFRNRIVFPIFDAKSRIIAFGARTLEQNPESAKYINSPETPIFVKGNNLYGLNFSKEKIINRDQVIIVEGYMDMIMPFQEGADNIVASSGTALTSNQIRLLKRYTKNIVVVFDADSAGQLAALRSLDLFIDENINVKVAVLPPGFDPDSFVREKGSVNFGLIIKNALGLFDYKIFLLLKRFDPKSIEGRTGIAHEMLSTISKFKDEILKTEYMKKLSQTLNLDEQALQEEAKKATERPYAGIGENSPIKKDSPSAFPAVERMILKLMLQNNNLVPFVRREISVEDFQDETIRQIITTIFDIEQSGKTVASHQLMNFFSDRSLHQIISELTLDEDQFCIEGLCLSDRDKMLEECLTRIKRQRFNFKKRILHERLIEAQNKNDEQVVNSLLNEYNSLVRNKTKEVAN